MDLSIPVPSWTTYGSGTPIVALHGGPGDTCGYLETLATLLPEQQWILYNQAGSGVHPLATPPDLNLEYLVAELEALRNALGLAQLTLMGHSWGAELALHYAVAYPANVARLALIAAGPLNTANAAIAHANLLRPLSNYERAALATARALRLEALESGDLATFNAVTQELVTAFYAPAWLYDRRNQPKFAAMYRENYGEFGFNPFANRRILASVDHTALWAGLGRISAPALILYGCQDFEPITQAYQLQAAMPNAQVEFINEAGHIPWLEQPAAVQQCLQEFLR